MYEVKRCERLLDDGTEIVTYSREITSCNILEVEAGTTGYKGGDTGHGSRTYFRITDLASTDMDINVQSRAGSGEGFEVELGGDTELQTMIEALKFITQVLEDGAKGRND